MKKLIKESKGFIVVTAIVIIVFIQISLITRTKLIHGHEYEECVYHKASIQTYNGQLKIAPSLIICTTFKDTIVYHKGIKIKTEQQFIKKKRITLKYVENIPEILEKDISINEFMKWQEISNIETL